MKKTIYFLLLLIFISCSQEVKKEALIIELEQKEAIQPIVIKDTIVEKEIKPITVVVVPCSNGYQYAVSLDLDITPQIEKSLSKFKEVEVIPFPFKKMQGSGYHGVFDKKYCSKILKNVEADFLILSELNGGGLNPRDAGKSKNSWGYRIRILNTKTLEQVNSFTVKGLENSDDIYGSIKKKGKKILGDLKKYR